MAQKLSASMPDSLDLSQNWQIQFLAVDPTTGNAVSGVTVSNAGFVCAQIQGTPTGLENGPFKIAPLWVPEPIDLQGEPLPQ